MSKVVPNFDKKDFINIAPVQANGTEESYYNKFKRSIMDQAKEYPLPVPIISIVQNGGTLPLLTLKSFSLWQGKQKSKKTKLV